MCLIFVILTGRHIKDVIKRSKERSENRRDSFDSMPTTVQPGESYESETL